MFQIHLHTLLLAKCKGVFKSLSFTVRSAWALFTKISAEKAKRKLLRLHVNYMHFGEVTTKTITHLNLYSSGFPGGAVVENLPANAGDTGSSPGLGRSHMPRSNWAREPQLLSLHVRSLCSATREAAMVRGPRTATKSGPRSLQLEKALAQKRRPNTAKNK